MTTLVINFDGTTQVVAAKPQPKFKVLLAKNYEPSKHNVRNWWVSEKLDGMRAYWTGKEMLTRTGKKVHVPKWFADKLPHKVELDGELFVGRGKFQKTISVVRKIKPIDEEWTLIRYHVFDAPGLDKPYEDRVEYIRGLENDVLIPVKTWPLTTSVEKELQKVEAMGGEGIMLRKPKSKYERKRSSSLLKVKSFLDDEAIVTGYTEGKGKYKGGVGGLQVDWVNDKGKLKKFVLGSGLTDDQRMKNPPSIGSVVTFKYIELTDAGIPRHGVFVAVRDYE